MKVGGYETVVKRYFEAWPNTTKLNYGNDSYPYGKCGIPPDNSMNLIRSYDDGSLPWPGIMFGLTISSVWYWCSDQVRLKLVKLDSFEWMIKLCSEISLIYTHIYFVLTTTFKLIFFFKLFFLY